MPCDDGHDLQKVGTGDGPPHGTQQPQARVEIWHMLCGRPAQDSDAAVTARWRRLPAEGALRGLHVNRRKATDP